MILQVTEPELSQIPPVSKSEAVKAKVNLHVPLICSVAAVEQMF